MRKLSIILLILCLLFQLPAQAAAPVQVDTFLASIQLPGGWTVDVDEFTTQAYGFVGHILRPVMIWANNGDYQLLLSIYDFDSDTQHDIGNTPDKDLGCFNTIVQYSGLTAKDSKLLPLRLTLPSDNRTFYFGKAGNGRYIATYRSKQLGYCYSFLLTAQSESVSDEAAQAQLQEIVTTLREVGVFYPNDAPNAMVVITGDSANIRAAASPDGHRVRTAFQGDTFPYLGEKDGWYMIGVDESVCYVSISHAKIQ